MNHVNPPVESDNGSKCRRTPLLKKAGSGSLAVSLLIHGFFVIIALLIIWRIQSPAEPVQIDIMSSGGGGTQGSKPLDKAKLHLVLKQSTRTPIVHEGVSSVTLPDAGSSLSSFSSVSLSSGKMSGIPGAGGGEGGGLTGGHGSGIGIAHGPGTWKAGAGFFGAIPSGNNIILCIDTSGSMRANLKDAGLAALRRELKKVIADLPPSVSFNLICFSQSADVFKPQSVAATQDTKNEALRFLERYYGGAGADFGRTRTERYGREGKDSSGITYVPVLPADIEELAGTEGGSRIDLAMVAAFERNPTTLFVLSDGAPGTRKSGASEPMEKEAVIELIHAKYHDVMGAGSKLLVHTISIDSDTDEGREGGKFLRKLAQKFGGKHKEVKPERLK